MDARAFHPAKFTSEIFAIAFCQIMRNEKQFSIIYAKAAITLK